jgi:hypothetical protein
MAKAKSRINRRNRRKMRGGNTGYTFNQQDVIGGQMSRVGYSHCNNPDYFNPLKVYDIPKIESNPVPSSQVGGKRSTKRRSTKRRSTKRTKKTKRSTKRK